MPPQRLFASAYRRVLVATFMIFAVFGMALPVLPLYVTASLGRSEAAVGAVFGVYAAAGILVRPLVGVLGDRYGRRLLVIAGTLVASVALFGHVAATSLTTLLALRFVVGAGQATAFVGLTTIALDVAPPQRRGEASSYLFLALQVGLGAGPLVGETLLLAGGYDRVWVVSSFAILIASMVALALPVDGRDGASAPWYAIVHPAGLWPGLVMACGSLGFVAFLAFAPLLGASVGLTRVAPLFVLASFAKAVARLLAGRIPDLLGPVRTAGGALVLMAVGLAAMGMWHDPVGLYVTVAVMSIGSAFLSPALILAVVRKSTDSSRTRAVATFTMFFDTSQALGPTLLGLIAVAAGTHAAITATAGTAVLALGLVAFGMRPWLNDDRGTATP